MFFATFRSFTYPVIFNKDEIFIGTVIKIREINNGKRQRTAWLYPAFSHRIGSSVYERYNIVK